MKAPIALRTVSLSDAGGSVTASVDRDSGECRLSGGEYGRSYLVLRYAVSPDALSAATSEPTFGPTDKAQSMVGWIVPGSRLAGFIPDRPLGPGECLHVSLVCPLYVTDADGAGGRAPCYTSLSGATDDIVAHNIGCTVPPDPDPGIYRLALTGEPPIAKRARRPARRPARRLRLVATRRRQSA